MAEAEPRVLHVLAHPGGGGEEYARLLEGMPGFRFARFHLTERGRPLETPVGAARLRRAARGCDLLHVHGDSAALVSLPASGSTPTVVTLHGSHLLRRARGIRGRAVRAGLRRALRRAEAVIAVSEAELAKARELLGAESCLELIHNGVPDREPIGDDERFAAREALGLRPGTVAALFVGELSERKQPCQFADAVWRARAANPAIVGLLAGDGPLRPELEASADEGVRLLGHREDVRTLLAAADVFVLPSLWEGLAYAVLDAMALGVATVVSDGPGNPDAVGETGLVFPAGDTGALSSALERLAGDAELRHSLGRAGAARARERFPLSSMLERTARVYESTLAGR
jgi:glycosyltransferase involved in cell wall biosynthesis